MERLLRVNMSELTARYEEIPERYALFGGRAMTSAIIGDEVPPTTHPLSEFNKLVFAPGILTGTHAPSSGRLSVGGKSPLTGTIKESNAGGITGQKLAGLGIRALVVEGKPKEKGSYILVVSAEGARLEPAGDLAGMGCRVLVNRLWEKYGKNAGIISIGPAGEALMPIAGVSTNDRENEPSRYAGRGGLGAVMGSKGLKAIVIINDNIFATPVAEPEKFKEAQKLLTKAIADHPVTSEALPTFGTAVLVNILNEAGGLPTRNFSSGRFETAHKTGGEAMAELVKARGGKGKMGHACHPGCIIRCSNIIPDEKGEVACSPIEYESAWALGANCGIDDLDVIAKLNDLCNDIGIDTIETGVTLGVMMEAGLLQFGDGQGAITLLDKEVRHATPQGRIFGGGAAVVGKIYGVERVPVVKGQGMPAYDPRAVKGIGVTYATTTMGADHTAGYSVASNILKVGGYIDPLKPEGQADLSRNLQIATAFVDSSGLCLFTAFPLLDIDYALPAVADMVAARFGRPFTVDDILEIGKTVLRNERRFNEAAGFNPAEDRLPEFMTREKLPPHNVVFDVPEAELDKVYDF